MVSGMQSTIKSEIWTTIYPPNSIDIFKGGKQENNVNLLGALAINGNSKTSEIAKFLYGRKFQKNKNDDSEDDIFPWNTSDMSINEIRKTFLEKQINRFNLLLTGRQKLSHSGKKIRDEDGNFKRYPDPVDLGYVVITGSPKNEKGKNIPKYFLTLKGFLLIFGYELESYELKHVIENASKISKFFGFIKYVMNQTSVDFVNEIFIVPIRKVLLRSDIFEGGNMDFYFSNFADMISISLSTKMKLIDKQNKEKIMDTPISYFYKKITPEYRRQYPYASTQDLISFKMKDEEDNYIPLFKKEGIESLMDNVFYYETKKEDWYESLTEHFYTRSELESSFLDLGYEPERYLVDKVMRSIHFEYYLLKGLPIPRTPRKKLLRSKSWKRHQKYKKDGIQSKPRNEIDLSNL